KRIRVLRNMFHTLIWVSTRQFSQTLQQFGVTLPQFITLAALTAQGTARNMSELTATTFQDPPTVTGIMNRLVKMGLVQRTRNETDRRQVLVKTTEAGHDLIRQIQEYTLQQEVTCYDHLSDEQLGTFEELMRYLLKIHIGRYKRLEGPALEAEIDRLLQYISDPINYASIHQKNKISQPFNLEVTQE
ncbi:MAG: MarR family transcriptional regulator, partial [Chloroflexi bacterium]